MPVAGQTLRDAHLRDQTGSLVLATRDRQGEFRTNPDPSDVIEPDCVLIVVGTESQIDALRSLVRGR